ncbi:MAG: hypothetical protein ACJ704_16160 [Nitrososphaeraceae archaeon]
MSRRTAMAEPRTSLHTWKGSIILLVVLVDISIKLYTVSGEKGSLSFDQLSKKYYIPYKKPAEKSQPKSIGDDI